MLGDDGVRGTAMENECPLIGVLCGCGPNLGNVPCSPTVERLGRTRQQRRDCNSQGNEEGPSVHSHSFPERAQT
jgi:hypothetical protein